MSQDLRRAVLVISNEELKTDVFNRVTSLMKGWPYTKHSSFSYDQIKTLNEYYDILSPSLTVIDASMAKTTSVEGIETVLEKVYESDDRYDLIIIDYYQKIDHSIRNPKLGIYESQARFVNFLDGFKNRYPAPILLLAQVNKESKKDQKPFKDRIEGRKLVLNIATVAIELVTDHQACRTDWIFHKSRFSSAGVRLSTGWDRGLYVTYSEQFKAEIAKKNIDATLKKNNEAGNE